MKSIKGIIFLLASVIIYLNAASQNAMINILTQHSGMVKKGETVFLEVTISNTTQYPSIENYKIKVHISVPSPIAVIREKGHVLPEGWTISSNTGSSLFLSNGTDVIPPHSNRTILISILGNKTGGPSTIIGQLSFSNGISPGMEPGSLQGDLTADNSSTTSIKVVR